MNNVNEQHMSSAEKKNLTVVELFYRRKKIFLFAKELLASRLKKKISRGLNFSIGDSAIGERTFDLWLKKKIWRRLNFSFRDSYRRKNFWPLG